MWAFIVAVFSILALRLFVGSFFPASVGLERDRANRISYFFFSILIVVGLIVGSTWGNNPMPTVTGNTDTSENIERKVRLAV